SIVDGINRSVRTHNGRRIRFGRGWLEIQRRGKCICREIPPIDMAVLVVDYGAFLHWIDSHRIDAPLPDGIRELVPIYCHVRRWSRDRDHRVQYRSGGDSIEHADVGMD